jgi:hypothetical protein
MSRQIFVILLIICAVFFGAVWYITWSRARAINSGEVFVPGQPGGKTKVDTAAPDAALTENAQTQQPAAAGGGGQPGGTQETAPTDPGVQVPPATDSIRRDPPNGMIFAGRGKYQLYRQGDITWRLDTDSGQACILFATDAEWRKPKVFSHGCGGT